LLAYNTSKSASTGLVRSLAGELAPRNIRVNAVLPGAITHRLDLQRDPAHGRALGAAAALPADIAAAVTFLASEDACWITGATLVVDGGFAVGRKAT
jgi:NAD(P)-dependent dehydrogenase (short-subunit alcohol dehydrogenase family)